MQDITAPLNTVKALVVVDRSLVSVMHNHQQIKTMLVIDGMLLQMDQRVGNFKEDLVVLTPTLEAEAEAGMEDQEEPIKQDTIMAVAVDLVTHLIYIHSQGIQIIGLSKIIRISFQEDTLKHPQEHIRIIILLLLQYQIQIM